MRRISRTDCIIRERTGVIIHDGMLGPWAGRGRAIH